MAEEMVSTYVTMTSEDILERIDPDYFHIALTGTNKGCSSDDIEFLRESALADFKKHLLEDEEGTKVVRFIQECYHKLDKQNVKLQDTEDAEENEEEGESEDNDADTVVKGDEVMELENTTVENTDEKHGTHVDIILHKGETIDVDKSADEEDGGEEETPFDTNDDEDKDKNLDNSTDAITDDEWFSFPFFAVEKNRLDILSICFRVRTDVGNYFWKDMRNLAMHAVSLPVVHEDMLALLLRHIDVNAAAINGNTALACCLRNRSISSSQKLWLVKYFIREGAHAFVNKIYFGSDLHAYVFNLTSASADVDENWREIIDELVEACKGVDGKDVFSQTVLMTSIQAMPPPHNNDMSNKADTSTHLQVIQYLLHKGANPNLADCRGNTSIHHAASNMTTEGLKLLLKHGAKANVQNRLGMTAAYTICAVHGWSENDDFETELFPFLDELINAGCDLNNKAMDKSTVLHFAAARLPAEIVHFLCKKGADVTAKDYLKRTPLHMTPRNDNLGIVRCLSEFQADLNATNINGDTPLHIACLQNNGDVMKELVELGANVEAVGDLGIKPIHLAAENGSPDLLKDLLFHADPDPTDDYGSKPLHYAASDGNYETVEILLEIGADKTIKDNNGMSPVDYAMYRGDSLKTAQLLAGNDTTAKFGNLPPLYFPNRPVIKREELDGYFDGLIEAFRKEGGTGVDVARQLLHSPGLGHVDLHSGEAKQISGTIVSMMERIVKRIGELEAVFEAKLLRAGSTLEDVKTGFPDEFDFLCEMVNFSQHVERTEESETKGFARIIMKEDAPPNILKYCLRSNRVINAAFFQRHFRALATQATYEILGEYNPQIYTGYILLTEIMYLFDPLVFQKTKLHGQTMTFRGKEFKFLDISVDINPVIFSPILPKEFLQTCHVLPDISTRGIYLIPKFCAQMFTLPAGNVPESADLWRYSTHHLEAEVLKLLPPVGRESYVMCKLLRMEPLTRGVEFVLYEDNFLTEEQLQRLYPSGGGVMGAADDDDDELASDAASPGDLEADDDDDDDASDEQDGGAITFTIHEELEDNPKDELTAESTIPSYYLKSIFIKEVESMIASGEKITDACLITIPWRVYNRLLEACNLGYLSTLFLPEQNMFHRAMKSRDTREAEKMRTIYCKNIIRVMESLGFKE